MSSLYPLTVNSKLKTDGRNMLPIDQCKGCFLTKLPGEKEMVLNPPTSLWFDNVPEMSSQIRESAILNEVYDGKIPDYQDDNVKWRLLNISKWEKIHNVTMSN